MPETITTTSAATTSATSTADAAITASAEATAAAEKAKADQTAASIAAAKPDFAAEEARIAALPEAERAAAQTVLDAKKAEAKTDAGTGKLVVPEKYDLKVPDGSGLDAAFVERTAAIARELGLDQSGAEKLMGQRAQEIASVMASYKAPDADGKGAGPAWIARNTAYEQQALADKDFGAGDQATFDTNVERAQQGLRILDGDKGPLRALLNESGWGSHPVVLKALAALGKRGGEGAQIRGATTTTERTKSDAERMYPSMFNPDGTPKT